MKKIALLALLLSSLLFRAQTPNPVMWFASYKSLSATEGEITITAAIEKNWHTYSQRPSDAGPIPTSFQFAPSKAFQLVGKTEETGAHEEFDLAFEARIYVFTDKAEFKQKIKLTGKPGFFIPFKVEFICCSDKTCLPPKTLDLSVKVQ